MWQTQKHRELIVNKIKLNIFTSARASAAATITLCTRTKQAIIDAHPRNAQRSRSSKILRAVTQKCGTLQRRNTAQHKTEILHNKNRNTARSSTESRQNASNVAAIGGNQAGGGSCQWECQEEPTANLELVPTLKTWRIKKVSILERCWCQL